MISLRVFEELGLVFGKVSSDLPTRVLPFIHYFSSGVNEGYRNDYSPPTDPNAPAPKRTFFRSASETIRDVYSNATPGPALPVATAPRKRGRSFSNTPQDRADRENETDLIDGVDTSAQDSPTAPVVRPTKPLRAGRPLGKSTSLPATAFSVAPITPSGETSATPSTITETATEDDWSDAAFGASGSSGPFRPTVL
jgi:hypothetical protein